MEEKKATTKPQQDSEADSAGSPAFEKSSSPDIWALEDTFPDVGGLLSPSKRASAADDDVLVVLDTNALLLPFGVGTQELPTIEDVYRKLIESNRLFVPARVIREFIKNRDGRLAEITKQLRDRSSATTAAEADVPLLRALPEMAATAEELSNARKKYLNAVNALVHRIRCWRGDDPVTAVYHNLFTGAVIIDVDEDRQTIERIGRRGCGTRFRQVTRTPQNQILGSGIS